MCFMRKKITPFSESLKILSSAVLRLEDEVALLKKEIRTLETKSQALELAKQEKLQ